MIMMNKYLGIINTFCHTCPLVHASSKKRQSYGRSTKCLIGCAIVVFVLAAIGLAIWLGGKGILNNAFVNLSLSEQTTKSVCG